MPKTSKSVLSFSFNGIMGLLRKFLHILIRFRTTIRWASIFDFRLSDRVILTQSWVLEADFLTLAQEHTEKYQKPKLFRIN